MDYAGKTRRISNSFFNQGLERAKIRNLTGAADSLKKSLHFNKYHTDARNLLGLIYYEIGETADALVQWVISTNLQPQSNRASYYLNHIQGKKGSLNKENQLERKFNQALAYAQGGSDDLAVLQLNKIVEAKPNYVKAQLLLSLIHLVHQDYGKAGKGLTRVLQTDRANPRAEWYMSVVKNNKNRVEPERRKLKNVLSHNRMQDDDIIIPPSYTENTRDQAVIHIIIGLLLGAAVIFFLVMPAKTKSISVAHNEELVSYSEQISQSNQEIDRLNEQIDQLEGQKKSAEDTLSLMTNDSGSVLNQYKILINILEAYRKGDFNQAVLNYSLLNQALVTDSDLLGVITEVRSDMEARGYQVLESLGDAAQASGDAAAALDYYLKSLNIKGDNWQVKYKAAVIYKNTGQKDQANDLFTDIINNSQDEELITQAKGERGF